MEGVQSRIRSCSWIRLQNVMEINKHMHSMHTRDMYQHHLSARNATIRIGVTGAFQIVWVLNRFFHIEQQI